MELPFENVKYLGEDTSISCPVCHCNIFYLEKGLPEIACPTCQVHGTVSFTGSKYKVAWNEDDIKNPRFSTARQHHHGEWIRNHFKEETPQIAMQETQTKMKQYQAWGIIYNQLTPKNNIISNKEVPRTWQQTRDMPKT